MPELFGISLTPEQLRRSSSTMAQFAGVRLVELSDGRPRGFRAAEVYTGSGLHFQVFLDRALDLGAASFRGAPLAWVHQSLGTPSQYEPEGYGWARTWGGGLMTTCGLTFFGQPEQDGDETLGLHGRIANLPASKVAVVEEWRGDDYVLQISGETRQVLLGAENLLLKRTITTSLGSTSIVVEDTVRNEAFTRTPHMILYHCNFGFPLVSPDSELLLSDEWVKPRDDRAEKGFAGYTHFTRPSVEYPEQVFFHKPNVGQDGYSAAAIVNRSLNMGAYVRFRAEELPCFAHWKQLAMGSYVCAFEPANHWEAPRARLREEGRLRHLEPGEEVSYRVELGVLPDADSIDRFRAQLP